MQLGGHKKIGRQRHGFPRDHERVGIIREQHEAHAAQEQVVVQAQEPRRGAFALTEVAAREGRDARGCNAEQQQENAGQPVAPQMHRQIGQADAEHELLRRHGDALPGAPREEQTAQRAGGEQYAADQREIHRPDQTCNANESPDSEHREARHEWGKGQNGERHAAGALW